VKRPPRTPAGNDRFGSNCEILKRSIVLPGFPRQRTKTRFPGWLSARPPRAPVTSENCRPWAQRELAGGRVFSRVEGCNVIVHRRSNIAHHRRSRPAIPPIARYGAIFFDITADYRRFYDRLCGAASRVSPTSHSAPCSEQKLWVIESPIGWIPPVGSVSV
jgi:hypothetical protein